MPSTYTTSLSLEKQATGENSATWGTKVNVVFDLIEQAIAGVINVTHDDTANYTLTATQGASNEARNMVVNVTGALTAARNVVVPTADKLYVFKNSTTGGYAVTVKTSGGSGISVANGETEILYCDAGDVLRAQTTPTGTGAPVRATGAMLDSPTLVTPALGTPSSGDLASCSGYPERIVQVVEATPITAVITVNSVIPLDNSIPQNTEGVEVITASITPTSATNRLRIEFDACGGANGQAFAVSALFQDATAGALAASCVSFTSIAIGTSVSFRLVYEMAAGTTSATTFKIRAGASTNTIYINGDNAGTRVFGGVSAARMRITEIKA